MTLDASCFIVTLMKKFDQAKFRPVRGIMYMTAGLSTAGIFITLGVSPNDNKMPISFIWYAVGGAIYIAGAINYIFRMPERCKPGAFDFCGASH